MTRSVRPRTSRVAKVWRRTCLCRRRHKHVLRHTFCTAIAEREGLDVVAELAGHADVRTSKRYVTVTAARTRGAIEHTFGTGSFAGGWGQAA